MSSELANVLPGLPAISQEDRKAFDDMAKGNTFLPRVDLFSSAKKIVKAQKFPANHFGFIKEKDKVEDLGMEMLAFPLDIRLKALDFSDPKKVKNCFDHKSDEFKRIQAESEIKRPQGEKNNFVCGPEFLMVIPKLGFVTYLLGSKSAKNIAKALRALTENRRFVKFSSYFKDVGSFSWQQVEVGLYEGTFDLPPMDEMVKVIKEFRSVSGEVFTESDLTDVDPDNQPVVEGTESGRPR